MYLTEKLKKVLLLTLKIAASFLLIRWVFTKINGQLVWASLQQANIAWLAMACVLFTVSKLLSAMRLNIMFSQIRVTLPAGINRQLYWLGMFYNLFLPGGIGGDAYKIIWLKKAFPSTQAIETGKAVVLDRISGMTAAVVILLFMAAFVPFLPPFARVGMLPAMVVACFTYFLLVKKQFTPLYTCFYITSFYSLGVQLLQCLCVWCLMLAFGVKGNVPEYMLLFLISSLVAVLPFTLGGIGAREFVFLFGSRYMHLLQGTSVTISLLFYLITAVVSLFGIRYFIMGKFGLKNASQAVQKTSSVSTSV